MHSAHARRRLRVTATPVEVARDVSRILRAKRDKDLLKAAIEQFSVCPEIFHIYLSEVQFGRRRNPPVDIDTGGGREGRDVALCKDGRLKKETYQVFFFHFCPHTRRQSWQNTKQPANESIPSRGQTKKDDCATRFLFGFLFQTESRSSEAAAQSDGRANKTDGGKIIRRRFEEAGQKMESKLWHKDKQADDGQIKEGRKQVTCWR